MKKIAIGVTIFAVVAAIMVGCAYLAAFGFTKPCGYHSPLC